MKVLVTVGSSPFETLIQATDNLASHFPKYHFTFQIASGLYKPLHGLSFTFSTEFEDVLQQSDIVITHCGAGTVFQLLELGKRFIVMPNMERIDKHQSDLAKYLEINKLALVCNTAEDLINVFTKMNDFSPAPYRVERFFAAQDIVDLF